MAIKASAPPIAAVGGAVLLIASSRREELFTAHAWDVFGHCSGFLDIALQGAVAGSVGDLFSLWCWLVGLGFLHAQNVPPYI